MMKYLYLGLLILALLLTGGILEYETLLRGTDSVCDPVEDALTALRNGELSECRDALRRAKAEWEKREGVLSALMNHARIEEIDHDFAEAEAVPVHELERCCIRLLHLLRELSDSVRTNWKNVL